MGAKQLLTGRNLASVLLACMLCFVATFARAIPVNFQKAGVPDFGQYVDSSWGSNYCAPTAAADNVWWFGEHGFSLLNQGGTSGSDVTATAIITSLGTLMNTSPTTGTADNNIRNGLAAYLDFFYPFRFDVKLVYASGLGGGAALWDFMRANLNQNDGVIPLITWDTANAGHAISMNGFFDDPLVGGDERILINDPATNGATHNWGGEYLSVNILGFGADRIDLAPWASGSGYIDAVVVFSVIPEPPTLVLMVWLVIVFLVIRLRGRVESLRYFA